MHADACMHADAAIDINERTSSQKNRVLLSLFPPQNDQRFTIHPEISLF